MTTSHQLVVSHKQLLLVAISAFGGMVTAMVATLAVVMPMMSAQASSLLDRQAEQMANLQQTTQPRQARTAGAVTADMQAADLGVCAEPPGQGGQEGQAEVTPTEEVGQVSSLEFGGVGEGFAAPEIPAPIVRELSTVNNNNVSNTVNDSHDTTYAVNSYNKGSFNQDSFNKTSTNVAVETQAKKQGDINVNVGNKANVVSDSYNTKLEQTKTVVKDSFNPSQTTVNKETHVMSQPKHHPDSGTHQQQPSVPDDGSDEGAE